MLDIVYNDGSSVELSDHDDFTGVGIKIPQILYISAEGEWLDKITNSFTEERRGCTIPLRESADLMYWYGDIAKTILSSMDWNAPLMDSVDQRFAMTDKMPEEKRKNEITIPSYYTEAGISHARIECGDIGKITLQGNQWFVKSLMQWLQTHPDVNVTQV